MPRDDFFDQLFKGIGDGIADIRQKVVEEGYFGRAVTQLDVDAVQWPEAKEPQAREAKPAQTMEPERDQKAPDLDIDR
jgi:hypothetical protein